MLHTLSSRIALAFVVLALAVLLGIGGALFVLLRQGHVTETTSRLVALTAPLVAQARLGLDVRRDVRAALESLREFVADPAYSLFLVAADGRLVSLDGDPLPIDDIRLPAPGRGEIETGTSRFTDGRDYAYAASGLRASGRAGPQSLVIATIDLSAQAATRDLIATLPVVGVVLILIGAPIVWLLARSVTRPMRRLAAAAGTLPERSVGQVPRPDGPLPLQGPREVRELTGRFNTMRAEIARRRRLEVEMLANLRHDLRTPLTVIRGFADALADGTASGDAAIKAAGAIVDETARLERMVDELGFIESLETGKQVLRPEQLEGWSVIRGAAARFGPQAEALGVTMTVDGSEETAAPRVPFAADRLAVDRMVGNLVENALAAVAPTHGHVWLAARALDGFVGSAESIGLSVSDDGPGFAPGSLEHIFERFYRGDPARVGNGSGLGLAIVRDLARAHGGDAVAENLVPRGARVSLILPVVPSLAAANGPSLAFPQGPVTSSAGQETDPAS